MLGCLFIGFLAVFGSKTKPVATLALPLAELFISFKLWVQIPPLLVEKGEPLEIREPSMRLVKSMPHSMSHWQVDICDL
jgi:hypothetical protein